MIQKDLGTGIAIIGIISAMLMVAGVSKKVGIMALGAIVGLGIVLIVAAPHRIERVLTFFQGDEASLTDDNNYHIVHAKIAIGTGGLFGVGVGNSVQATGYLPEAINDSVFAIMGETFGFAGLVMILAIFTALLLRLLKVMDHLVDVRFRPDCGRGVWVAWRPCCHECGGDDRGVAADGYNVATPELWWNKYDIYFSCARARVSIIPLHCSSIEIKGGES